MLIIKLLSQLTMKKHLDFDYEEQQFVITRDSFNAIVYLKLKSSAGTQRLPPKCVLLC